MAKSRSERRTDLSPVEAAWVAALVDGEGSILIRPTGERKLVVNVQVASTDYDIVERAADWTGVGRISGPVKKRAEHHKPAWIWTVSARTEVLSLLEQIEPWLLSRRGARAREAMAAIRGFEERERRFCKNGHDKDGCGVNAQGACKDCRNETNRKQRDRAAIN